MDTNNIKEAVKLIDDIKVLKEKIEYLQKAEFVKLELQRSNYNDRVLRLNKETKDWIVQQEVRYLKAKLHKLEIDLKSL